MDFLFLLLFFQAYNKGKTYKGRALKISWYRAPVPPVSPSVAVTTPTTPTALKKVEEELGLDFDAELVSSNLAIAPSACFFLSGNV